MKHDPTSIVPQQPASNGGRLATITPSTVKLKLFRIEIIDCGERETVHFRGNDAKHAVERFLDRMMDTGGVEGIEVLSARRA